MDTFVKEIVNAVLSGGGAAHAGRPEPDIPRPNYQREQAQKRLTAFDPAPGRNVSSEAGALSGFSGKPPAAGPPEKPGADATALRLVQLSGSRPANVPTDAPPGLAQAAARQSRGRDESQPAAVFEVIEVADSRTLRLAGLNDPPGSAVGLASAPFSLLSQLFAADMAVSGFPALTAVLRWNEREEEGFFFRCAGKKDDVAQAIGLMKRYISSAPAICSANSPGPVLKRRLNVTGGFLAGIDGIPFVSLLPLVNCYWKEHPDSILEFLPGRSHLLVQGEENEALQALQTILYQWDKRLKE